MYLELPHLKKHGYTIIGNNPVGVGSYGSVYRGSLLNGKASIAIKRFHKKFVLDRNFRENIHKEASLLYNNAHKYIINFIDYIEEDEELYILTEFIDGWSLKKYITKTGYMYDLMSFVKIYSQILSGLNYIHTNGILHLDIKPANIMLDKKFNVKIVDLGISKAIYEIRKEISGTVRYMSPEQTKGEKLDIYSDVYSVGVTMITSLLGTSPFQGQSDNELIFDFIRNVPLIQKNTYGEYVFFQANTFRSNWKKVPNIFLAEILLKATNKSASSRYSSCRAFYQDLQRLKQNYYV